MQAEGEHTIYNAKHGTGLIHSRCLPAAGFAISIDALLAMILTIALLGFVGIGLQEEESLTTVASAQISQTADDAFTALDNSGFLVQELVDRFSVFRQESAANIYSEAKKMLPANAGLRVEVTEYIPTPNLPACRSAEDFDTCFPVGQRNTFEAGEEIPANKEVVHGRKMQIMRRPVADKTGEDECALADPDIELKKEENFAEVVIASLNDEIEKNLETEIDVDPDDYIECDDGAAPLTAHEKAKVTVKLRDSSRKPVAIMLAMDESGSMAEYDILEQEETGSFNDGTCGGGACYARTDNCPTSNEEYTDWQLISGAEFNTLTDVWQRLPDGMIIDTKFYNFFYSTKDDSTTCGTIPKIKMVDEDGTEYYGYGVGGSAQYYVGPAVFYFPKDPAEIWEIYGWSNVAYTTNLYRRFYEGSLTVTDRVTTVPGSGTAEGSGEECSPNLGTAQLIGRFDTPGLKSGQELYKVKVQAYVQGYDSTVSGCCSRLFLRKQGEGTPLAVKNCSDGTCTESGLCETTHYTTASGTYEIYLWTDDEVSITFTGVYATVQEYPNPTLAGIEVSGGTCDGGACSINPSNCDNKTGWKDEGTGGDDLGTFTIAAEEHLLGLKAVVSGSGYAGVCSYPQFRLRQPSGGIETTCSGSCTLTATGSPLETGTWELEGWADEETDYTAEWYIQRVDAAKRASRAFIDNLGTYPGIVWGEDDVIGALSYSDAINSVYSLDNDRSPVRDDFLNGLSPSDQTATGDAIEETAEPLGGAGDKIKIMVLLTDGKANLCAGGATCSESEAADYAILKADEARNDYGITIYVIGFADESIIGDYEDTLKQIAKDSDTAYCDDGENCGKYYYAEDEDVLDAVYQQILGEIAEQFGLVDIVLPFPDGMEPIKQAEPSDYGDFGVWSDSDGGGFSTPGGDLAWDADERTISLSGQSITHIAPYWFAMQFDVNLPCNSTYCDLNYVLFPPQDLPEKPYVQDGEEIFEWPEVEGTPCIETPCYNNYLKVPFRYVDLGIEFLAGTIEGTESVSLDVKVENLGYKDIGQDVKISFYLDDPDYGGTAKDTDCTGGCELLGSIASATVTASDNDVLLKEMTLCASQGEEGCTPDVDQNTEAIILDISVGAVGDVYAVLDEGGEISQCIKNNKSVIYCKSPAELKFYTIDYFVWVR